MVVKIQFLILVTFAFIICNTSAQNVVDIFFENLKKNRQIVNGAKVKDAVERDKSVEDYYYDDEEDDYEPPPTTSSKGRSKAKEENLKGEAGSTKKHGGPKKAETAPARPPPSRTTPRPAPPRPTTRPTTLRPSTARPSSDKGVAFRLMDDPEPDAVNVLTVKKFMFQAQPVIPAVKRGPDSTTIYYYL